MMEWKIKINNSDCPHLFFPTHAKETSEAYCQLDNKCERKCNIEECPRRIMPRTNLIVNEDEIENIMSDDDGR